MTPQARLSAAAEILDELRLGAAPAEVALKRWGQTHRFAGSKDRRAIADRVYRCLRARARLAWAMGADNGRALVLGSLALIDGLGLAEIEPLFSGEGYGPPALTEAERARLSAPTDAPPGWIEAGLPSFVAADFQALFGKDWAAEAEALLTPRAPIDLRVNGARADVQGVAQALAADGLSPEPTPWSAWGLRLAPEPPPNIQKLAAFQAGQFEVQDEGSQIAAWLAGARPGMIVVDYCAGGGGKTLALAQALGPAGNSRLIACDVDGRRLSAIQPRLARAGVSVDLRRLGSEGEGVEDLERRADLVCVDAPCSGSGVWRRRPEAALRLTEAEVARLHALQVLVLSRAARLVRPGGRLVYVTCSVLSLENEASADAFEAAQPEFAPRPIAAALASPCLTDAGRARLIELAQGHRLRLSPRRSGTDGFFISQYERLG